VDLCSRCADHGPCFIFLVVAYGLLVRRPLDRILAERAARTSGAVEKAKDAISEAEAKTAEYEDRLRKARAEIFAARRGPHEAVGCPA